MLVLIWKTPVSIGDHGAVLYLAWYECADGYRNVGGVTEKGAELS